ncbi:MAG: NfeD family protein [Bacteroidales bacterium]|nr:NfeD family protein [Bacteroidales bacterium]
MEIWVMWLIATAVLVIIELMTGMVASFCLAIGCLASMIVSLFSISVNMQLLALAIGTILSFIFLAPVIRKWQQQKGEKNPKAQNSNMDALIGRMVVVTQTIPADGELGRIRIDGDNWQARSISGAEIEEGRKVRVVSYDSIIIEVEEV